MCWMMSNWFIQVLEQDTKSLSETLSVEVYLTGGLYSRAVVSQLSVKGQEISILVFASHTIHAATIQI